MFRVFLWPILAGGLIGAWLYGYVSWWIAAIGVLIGWWSFRRFRARYEAASNALLAKHTFDAMSPDDTSIIMAEVRNVVATGAIPDRDPEATLKILPEAALFGFVALAMARLKIPPKVGDGWYSVNNPYVAILGAERELAFVQDQLLRQFGIVVNVALRRGT